MTQAAPRFRAHAPDTYHHFLCITCLFNFCRVYILCESLLHVLFISPRRSVQNRRPDLLFQNRVSHCRYCSKFFDQGSMCFQKKYRYATITMHSSNVQLILIVCTTEAYTVAVEHQERKNTVWTESQFFQSYQVKSKVDLSLHRKACCRDVVERRPSLGFYVETSLEVFPTRSAWIWMAWRVSS